MTFDTSTHGGFMILWEHVNAYRPPLNMAPQTPIHKFTANNLHGYIWLFKHIFRIHVLFALVLQTVVARGWS